MDEMTIGEISRSLARLETSQREQIEKLDEIKDQTSKTNGYVGDHERRLNRLDEEVRDLKRPHQHHHDLKRSADRPNAITVSIPITKTSMTMLFTVVGGIIAAALTAAARLFGLM